MGSSRLAQVTQQDPVTKQNKKKVDCVDGTLGWITHQPDVKQALSLEWMDHASPASYGPSL
jgi:hypothetical protein